MFGYFCESEEQKLLREKVENLLRNRAPVETVLREAGVSSEDELDNILGTDPFVKIMKPVAILLLIMGYMGIDSDSMLIVIPSALLIVFSLFLVFAFFGAKSFRFM